MYILNVHVHGAVRRVRAASYYTSASGGEFWLEKKAIAATYSVILSEGEGGIYVAFWITRCSVKSTDACCVPLTGSIQVTVNYGICQLLLPTCTQSLRMKEKIQLHLLRSTSAYAICYVYSTSSLLKQSAV